MQIVKEDKRSRKNTIKVDRGPAVSFLCALQTITTQRPMNEDRNQRLGLKCRWRKTTQDFL